MGWLIEVRDIVNNGVDNLIIGVMGPIRWTWLRLRGFEISINDCRMMVREHLRCYHLKTIASTMLSKIEIIIFLFQNVVGFATQIFFFDELLERLRSEQCAHRRGVEAILSEAIRKHLF